MSTEKAQAQQKTPGQGRRKAPRNVAVKELDLPYTALMEVKDKLIRCEKRGCPMVKKMRLLMDSGTYRQVATDKATLDDLREFMEIMVSIGN